MVSGQDVQCSEADLTGEPDTCPKKLITENNMQDLCVMLGKSMIVDGTGFALVVAVGIKTASGAIEEAQAKEPEQTHL
jgi:magnesium-transporting ATPase (P-type)